MKLPQKLKATLLISWMPAVIFGFFGVGVSSSWGWGIVTAIIIILGSLSIVTGVDMMDKY